MARITLRLFTALVAAVTLVTGLGLFAVPSRAASLNEVALYSVYRTSTSDYFETTNPSVAYAAGNSVIRIEGSVFSPSAPQPRGTVPLIRWYSSTQQDNFTTTQWTGGTGTTHDDYSFSALEGYVHNSMRMGTSKLAGWYSANRQDHRATTDPSPPWQGGVGTTGGDGNLYSMQRIEGYVDPTSAPQPPYAASVFGGGIMTPRDSGDGSAKPVAALGTRPLLVVDMAYKDVASTHTVSQITNLFFGPATPNVAGYISQVSNSRFGFRNAGVYAVTSTRKTTEFSGNPDKRAEGVKLARQAGFNFAAYDTNGDHVVTGDELSVSVLDSLSLAGGGWGQFGPMSGPVDVGDSTHPMKVDLWTALDTEYGSFSLISHELLHQLGAVDIYGDAARMSSGLSAMTSSRLGTDSNRDMTTFEVDAWHKVRLGWVTPRVVPVTSVASCDIDYASWSRAGTNAPILFFDPRRGVNEYYLMEFRANGAPDSSITPTGGVAVWHVRTDAGFRPYDVASGYSPTGTDKSVWTVGTDGTRGGASLWKAANGEFSLKWSDGSTTVSGVDTAPVASSASVGMAFQVTDKSANGPFVSVQWRPTNGSGTPTLRLTAATASSMAAGASNLAYGTFGLAASQSARLWKGNASYPVTITSWSCTTLAFQVPAGTPAGDYDLVLQVYNATYGLSLFSSNGLPLTVTAS